MPKIQKQPKRPIKKLSICSLKNPFISELSYIPQGIANNICHLQKIMPNHIDELITSPQGSPTTNLNLMK